MKKDPLKPSATLLIKLGSAMIHAEEIFDQARGPMLNMDTMLFDLPAFKTASDDPEVLEWVKSMGPMLPLKRKP